MEIVEIKMSHLGICKICGKLRFIRRIYARDRSYFLLKPILMCKKCLKSNLTKNELIQGGKEES